MVAKFKKDNEGRSQCVHIPITSIFTLHCRCKHKSIIQVVTL